MDFHLNFRLNCDNFYKETTVILRETALNLWVNLGGELPTTMTKVSRDGRGRKPLSSLSADGWGCVPHWLLLAWEVSCRLLSGAKPWWWKPRQDVHLKESLCKWILLICSPIRFYDSKVNHSRHPPSHRRPFKTSLRFRCPAPKADSSMMVITFHKYSKTKGYVLQTLLTFQSLVLLSNNS